MAGALALSAVSDPVPARSARQSDRYALSP